MAAQSSLASLFRCRRVRFSFWLPSREHRFRREARRAFAALLLVPSGIIAGGCGQGFRDSQQELPIVSAAGKAQANGTHPSDNIPLRHDFGIVRAGDALTHTFRLDNTSAERWTVEEIKRTCNCTATTMTSLSINPGESESITLKYTAPHTSRDEERTVTVRFREPTAPVVMLIVSARVRADATPLPARITISTMGAGTVLAKQFEIGNFSKDKWSSVAVDSSAPWIRPREVSHTEPPATGLLQGATELWQVHFEIDATGLPAGVHRGSVQMTALIDGDSMQASVPIEITVSSPVSILPGHAFFGCIRPGHRATKQLVVRLAQGAAEALEPDEVAIKHTGSSSDITTSLVKVTNELWQMTVTLRAPLAPGLFENYVHLSFPNASHLPEISVPVRAVVEVAEQGQPSAIPGGAKIP